MAKIQILWHKVNKIYEHLPLNPETFEQRNTKKGQPFLIALLTKVVFNYFLFFKNSSDLFISLYIIVSS